MLIVQIGTIGLILSALLDSRGLDILSLTVRGGFYL